MNVVDRSGRRFGRWTVIAPEYVGARSRVYYTCRCDCGTTKSVMAASLRDGRSKSCGCAMRLPKGQSSRNSLYAHYRRGASKRGILFELTITEFSRLTSKPCYYCGCLPSQIHQNSARWMGSYLYNGIDRVFSDKPYTRRNCVSCCGVCNWMKGKLTKHQFIKKCKQIALHKGGS